MLIFTGYLGNKPCIFDNISIMAEVPGWEFINDALLVFWSPERFFCGFLSGASGFFSLVNVAKSGLHSTSTLLYFRAFPGSSGRESCLSAILRSDKSSWLPSAVTRSRLCGGLALERSRTSVSIAVHRIEHSPRDAQLLYKEVDSNYIANIRWEI